ncbi:MAG: DUF5916 domain-containing protein [Candidatus Hydrothermia bacterium]
MCWMWLLTALVMSNYILRIPALSEKPANITDISIILEEGFPVADFLEVFPRDSAPPDVKTEAYIGVYKDDLYVLFFCHESEKVRYQVLKRDEMRTDNDMVFVLIDPDNSGTRSYAFGINPAGSIIDYLDVSGDCIISYDFNWTGYAEVRETLWIALLDIPLSNFSKVKEDDFRIYLNRSRPSQYLYQYVWPPVPSSSSDDPFAKGILEGSWRKVSSLNVIPYILSSDGPPISIDKVTIRAGATGKYSHESGLSVLFALNPDFSTVETDEPQITVNNPYALYLAEKRPIFLEGGDIFERQNYMIYTRRVNEPIGVVKVLGKFKNTEMGVISAYDLSNSFLYTTDFGSFELPVGDSALVNIATLRHYFDKGTYLGAVLNTRNTTTDFANYVGFLEGGFNFRNTLLLSGVFGYSRRGKESPDYKGELVDASVSLKLKNFTPRISYFAVSEDFSNQNGFLKSSNVSSLTSGFSFRFPVGWGILNFGQLDFSYSINSDYARTYDNDSLYFCLMSSMKYRTDLYVAYMRYSQQLLGTTLTGLDLFNLSISSAPTDFIRLTAILGLGNGINFYAYTPDKAHFTSGSLKGDLMLGKKVLMTLEYRSYSLGEKPDIIASQNTYFLKFLYNPTQRFSFRWINSYDSEELASYPLLSYQISPYTIFFFGGSVKGPFEGKLKEWDKNIFVKAQVGFEVF